MTPELLNSIGLVLDIIGALIMFFNSQKVSYATLIHNTDITRKLQKKAKLKNRLANSGALFLVVGFSLQLLSNWL